MEVNGFMGYTVVTVQRKRDDSAMEVLEIFEDLGLKTAHYSERLGKSRGYIHNWRYGVTAETVEPVLRELIKTAKDLIRTDLEREGLVDVLDRHGVSLTELARRAGVSRQAIYKAVEGGLNDEQRERFELALRRAGRELLRRAQHIKREIGR